LINKTYIIALFFLCLFSDNTFSQHNLFNDSDYFFINKSDNYFVCNNITLYDSLFELLTSIGLRGEGRASIVHIGDSHIQADYFSGNFRKYLQTFFLGSQSGRGFVFPYKVAKTNNPLSYSVTSKGIWEHCKNIEHNFKCELGLAGMAVITKDQNAEISVNIEDKTMKGYDFNRLMVFHKFGNKEYAPYVSGADSIIAFPQQGYTLFKFNENRKRLTLQLKQTDTLQNNFSLYGFNFDSDDNGIFYHTVGVNGARVDSYLKCKYFVPHLSSLQPDWVIVSLGTNDVYTNNFNATRFEENLNKLIINIQLASPTAAILFTTPGDHLMKRKYRNDALPEINEIIKQKAMEYGQSYWDLYSVMGGDSSTVAWYKEGLGHTDYLHFTEKGYLLQAQLFFEAFLHSYDTFLEEKILNK